MSERDILIRKTPASWHREPGRDATPLGNGRTGVLVWGGQAPAGEAYQENIQERFESNGMMGNRKAIIMHIGNIY